MKFLAPVRFDLFVHYLRIFQVLYLNEIMIELKAANGESSFALVCVLVIALNLWSRQSLSWERLKLHRSHGGLFWAPTESGRGQAAGSSDSFVRSAGEPLSSQHVGSLHLFIALCDLNRERSWRMLCATSPGEYIELPALTKSAYCIFKQTIVISVKMSGFV